MVYLILILALVAIVAGANWLVEGSVEIAKRYKVSDFVIGAAIIGVGTSMPELIVSSLGAFRGNADIAIGNVVGSNIFNILGILGLTAVFFPVKVSPSNRKFDIPLCFLISMLTTLIALNFFDGSAPVISRWDGLVLLLFFGVFLYHSFFVDGKRAANNIVNYADTKEVTIIDEKLRPLGVSIIKVIGGLAVLIFGCDVFVEDAIDIARSWGVNDALISVTLIACGTSLPELAASITAALKKNTQMALGNILGSNIFNLTLILGLSSQITTLTSVDIGTVDYLVMTGAVVLVFVLGLRGKIRRLGGALMVLSFIAYNMYLIQK